MDYTTLETDKLKTLVVTTFGIKLPVTREEFKSAFREQAKKLHPDTQQKVAQPSADNPADKFIAMKSLYDYVTRVGVSLVLLDYSKEPMTEDGTLLTELGKGIQDKNTNGKDCPSCHRVGYIERDVESLWKICENCVYGMVPRVFACRDCKGTGKFTTVRTLKEVACRMCKGTGKFVHPTKMKVCDVCNGRTYYYDKANRVKKYSRCWTCSGCGEIPVLNPVLPKSRLASVGRN